MIQEKRQLNDSFNRLAQMKPNQGSQKVGASFNGAQNLRPTNQGGTNKNR